MNSNHFEKQIGRLIDVYGAKCFPRERVSLVWDKVRFMTDHWMAATVSNFIEYEQYAPIGSKWDDALANAREKKWGQEKETSQKETELATSPYSGEDLGMICGQIVERVQGKMRDEGFACFQKVMTPTNAFRCNKCLDTGWYSNPNYQPGEPIASECLHN